MNIEEFCKNFNLGKVKSITKLTGGLMHKMYKVETETKTYAIKVLNPEVMKRKEALNNFILSETISNLASSNGIPVSSALKINDSYVPKYKDNYYMVFTFLEGRTLSDEEITIEHCRKIGSLLASIHNLDYKSINLKQDIKEDHFYVDWEKYTKNDNFNKMSYKDLYLTNYHKYYSLLKRSVERFNESNKIQTICHRDMDPKNVMWVGEKPVVIDWESASMSNPYRELIEYALCWSGFLSNDFDENKFKAVIEEYAKTNKLEEDSFSTICGNLVGRFGWLEYNLKRSLGIKSNDQEEMLLAEKEVTKTMDEIERYLNLIESMYKITSNIANPPQDEDITIIEKIISNNDILKNTSYKKINSGFTNTIYEVGNYIVRICTNVKNESRFKAEIDFYNNHKSKYIPKLYIGDTTKSIVPYFYEIIERIEGDTLYEIWYQISEEERLSIIKKIIEILKSIHSIPVNQTDFKSFIKETLTNLIAKDNIKNDSLNKVVNLCDKYFKDTKCVLTHNDLHFDNFIYNKGELKLIDFERCMIAPVDYDFKIFNRYNKDPWKWASMKTDMLTIEDDYQNIMDLFISNYDELRNIPYLEERLNIYLLIDYLKEYKSTNDNNVLNNIIKLITELN